MGEDKMGRRRTGEAETADKGKQREFRGRQCEAKQLSHKRFCQSFPHTDNNYSDWTPSLFIERRVHRTDWKQKGKEQQEQQ
jgi:hypothetical protein